MLTILEFALAERDNIFYICKIVQKKKERDGFESLDYDLEDLISLPANKARAKQIDDWTYRHMKTLCQQYWYNDAFIYQ